MTNNFFERTGKTSTTRSNAGTRLTPNDEEQTPDSMINIESPLPGSRSVLQSIKKLSMLKPETSDFEQSLEEDTDEQNTTRVIQCVSPDMFGDP